MTSNPASTSITTRATASAAPPYLRQLNSEQRAAVETLDGPLLVLAGAGTGKTPVYSPQGLPIYSTRARRGPVKILAVTFTNKAARK